VLRTTIKETNIHNNHNGNINLGKQGKRTYLTDVARTTIKETLPEKEVKFLKGMSKQIAFDPNDVAKTTIKETTQLSDYLGGMKYNDGRGYLTNPQNPKNTNRIFTTREIKGNFNSGKTGLGYLTNKKTAPNTNRQFTTGEFTGNAGASEGSRIMMSRDNMLNAQIFDTKEKTLVGRKPTLSGPKSTNGASNLCLEMKRNQLSKLPIGNVNNVVKIPTYNNCDTTSVRNQYKSQIERIDSALLEPYKKNPYTHFFNEKK